MSAGGPKAFQLRGVQLLWPDSSPCSEFLMGAASSMGRSDFSQPLKILSDHWAETVGDLRLLVQEGLLRSVALPIRLCVWIEEELSKVVPVTSNGTVVPLPSPQGGVPTLSDLHKDKKQRLTADETGVVFRYQADFDTNGVLYWIGSFYGTRSWMNPAESGLVTVGSIGVMPDSAPASAVVGREAVRCVTVAETPPSGGGQGAWFVIDLGDRFVLPTAYSLRHYSSWDTECLRDWRLEATNDRERWVVLREHKGDHALNGRGSTYTWPIAWPPNQDQPPSPQHFFCAFRLLMTGANSNGHLYLACSGFEVYGLLHQGAPSLASLASSPLFSQSVVSLGLTGPTKQMAAKQLNVPMAVVTGPTAGIDGPEFKYQMDFDGNGILYYIGTAGGTRSWVNPADSGAVVVTASSLMHDSVPPSAVVGLQTVRCVTKAQPDSWFCIDLRDKAVRITRYTLRHYSSWDNEALRHWRLEASLNGRDWVILSVHDNDESLNVKGATHTWTIPESPQAQLAYRYFRIFQTGENSNKHYYLSLSGFEIYGWLFHLDGVTPFVFPSPSASSSSSSSSAYLPSAPPPVVYPSASSALSSSPVPLDMKTALPNGPAVTTEFRYASDFDGNGIVYFLGTQFGAKPWKNPAILGLCRVTSSSLAADSEPVTAIVGDAVVRCVTKAEPRSWFAVDFMSLMVRPTAYTLRHYVSWDTECLRNWSFQGTVDGENWVTLRDHKEDAALEGKGATHTWFLENIPGYYRAFRVLQTGANSNKHHFLALSGFEIYGFVPLPRSKDISLPPSAVAARVLDATPSAAVPVPVPPLPRASSSSLSPPVPQSQLPNEPSAAFVFHPATSAATSSSFSLPASVSALSSTAATASSSTALPSSGPGPNPLTTPLTPHSGPVSVSLPLPSPSSAGPLPQPPSQPPAILQQQHISSVPLAPSSSSSAPLTAESSITWDPEQHGQFMQLVSPTVVRNAGSSDKWQMIRSAQSWDSGRLSASMTIMRDAKTSNTWRFIFGIVPAAVDCKGPKQWVGTGGSWGYIAGTGGKCHQAAKSLTYGQKFVHGDTIGVVVDFEAKTLSFWKNNIPQGIAFDDVVGPVHLACSTTATDALIAVAPWTPPTIIDESEISPHSWDPLMKSQFLEVDVKTGIVTNAGSSDKWQSVRSVQRFGADEDQPLPAGKQYFEVEILANPTTPNSWQAIVGVVPPAFQCNGPKQWVGATKSWGYIAGTGGKCHDMPQSDRYGEKYTAGDVIGVSLDFQSRTIEFFKNGVSQGVAYEDLKGPVYAAVSLTGTGASARLRVKKL